MRNIEVSTTVPRSLSNIPTAVFRSVVPLRLGTTFFQEQICSYFTFDYLEEKKIAELETERTTRRRRWTT